MLTITLGEVKLTLKNNIHLEQTNSFIITIF